MTHNIKNIFKLLCATLLLCIACTKPNIDEPTKPGDDGNISLVTDLPERNGESGITYQLLVYTFADSNGDGIGDFNGIISKLDYLKGMGVSALWLSPIHPSGSYHGYDVKDYSGINPDFGTEADFQNLLNAAHSKGIKIYLDFVLNHTSRDHHWFQEAKANVNSKYRNYYIFSDDPIGDIRNGVIPMISTEGSSGYDSGQWFSAVSSSSAKHNIKFTLKLANGKPSTLMAEQIQNSTNEMTRDCHASLAMTNNDNAVIGSECEAISDQEQNTMGFESPTKTPLSVIGSETKWSAAISGQNTKATGTGVWLYYGDGLMKEFNQVDNNTLTLSLEFESSWGVLVRTSQTQWDSYKWGAASGNNQLKWDEPLKLVNSNQNDILLPGMTGTMYHSHFWTEWFADLNYGAANTCENSEPFIEVCKSADNWINMGVDGFRLDAIKHIYHNANSDENPTFLKKFYDHCNTTYKAAGGQGNIYMVGEHFSEAREVAPYYKGLPAFFEFSFWWRLKDAINSSKGSGFVGNLVSYSKDYAKYRSDFIVATKLTNHDENRAGSDLSNSIAKMKLAGTVLLTSGGEPYIYQGEELGYTSTKNNGDEYVRTPIMWTKGGKLASKYLGGKLTNVSNNLSVEAQTEDEDSILELYKKFGDLRDRYLALSKGKFEACNSFNNEAICAYYRTYNNQKILVIHNFGANTIKVDAGTASLDKVLAINGQVSIKDRSLTLGSYASILLIQ